MKRRLLLATLFLSALALGGCVPEGIGGEEVSFNEADLLGKWLLDGSQEYWRFDSGHYGETWDAAEDVQEGEGTRFSWELDGATLEILLTGEMGQVVPYDYRVVALTGQAMKLRDVFDNEKTYHKI